MLLSLRIRDIAVIDELELTLSEGLGVLTGETGAGKSVAFDALGLILGGRADSALVRTGCDEGCVEAVLSSSKSMAARLEALGLPSDGDEWVIRRTVPRTGRGRVHVNGALTTTSVLAKLFRGFVELAGQHAAMRLLDGSEHRALVDRLARLDGSGGPREAFAEDWKKLSDCEARLNALGGDDGAALARMDFLSFQLSEWERLGAKPGEDEVLEAEFKRLRSVEKLRAAAAQVDAALTSDESGLVRSVGRAVAIAQDAERIDGAWQAVRERLGAAWVELDEATHALSSYQKHLLGDPARLAEVEERLDGLRRLGRKHGASLPQLFEKAAQWKSELETLSHRGVDRATLQEEQRALRAKAQASAASLTEARRGAAKKLERRMRQLLGRLALGKATFRVELTPEALGPAGAEAVQFLFCANVGEALQPLHEVASGGEASRLLLALTVAAGCLEADAVYVFDEIDAGVGGAVADVMGALLSEVSQRHQVLCVTHAPQVAAWGDHHLSLSKQEQGGRTVVKVQVLRTQAERERELARMLSGSRVSKEAVGAAQALLKGTRRDSPRQSLLAGREVVA